MTPDRISPLVFLDANILAKPVTRSLLLFSAAPSGNAVTWSALVEDQADRHRRPNQASATQVREKAGLELSPPSDQAPRYSGTKPSDRRVLADAAKSGAQFIITEDVDDFGEQDLIHAQISATNPDLFLAERVITAAFHYAAVRMAAAMTSPLHTPEQLFARLGRQHPRAVSAHQIAFSATPLAPVHPAPAVLFRGRRCLRCSRTGSPMTLGVCSDCHGL
ncbi:MAG: hypothetical protein FWG16_05540 [Micrococcales bacterium]|nr:hypothetical protein [Micrococcales bacterium]